MVGSTIEVAYRALPTLKRFHRSGAQFRCIVGPVGSGKTTAAAWEICYYLPAFMKEVHKISRTKWVIVRNCFDDKTEILTNKRGWQLFKDLVPTDKVASRGNNGELVFETPTKYYKDYYNGQMIRVKSQNSDLLVTPDHNLFTSRRYSRKKIWLEPKQVKAQDIYGRDGLYRFITTCTDWKGEIPKSYKTTDFFEFLGFWFAEGYAGKYKRTDTTGYHYRLVVCQNDSNGYVEDLLNRNDFKYGRCSKPGAVCFNYTISIVNDDIKCLIEELCKYGKATNKWVPLWIKNAPKELLKAFLAGFMRGDGSPKTGPKNCDQLYTASKQLADDLQEIIFKTGRYTVINHAISPTKHGHMYILTLMTPSRDRPGIRKNNWDKVDYNGNIYCVEVPSHVIYVRRNGKCCWCGQSYVELRDTTQRTLFDWFDWGKHKVQANEYILKYPDGMELEILFRSCDRPEDVKKFKSLEVTGYWIDESIEVKEEIKLMLKNRVGRYPRKCPVRWGIETTNPPDVEHTTYSQFKWDTPPPGPMPEGTPLENHEGFWQPPRENDQNLRPGYYDELRIDYSDNPDWIDTYIDGKPGVFIQGSSVYKNFKRDTHVSREHLTWSGGALYRGWDNSGNWPSCIVLSVPTSQQIHVLAEFHGDKMGIVDFTRHVVQSCNVMFPNATYEDWGDPAGENRFSRRSGGFTSNAELMRDFGVDVKPSEQNWTARKESVEQQLRIIDGMLIDSRCIRLINGFIGGYCYPEIGSSGSYRDKPMKNRWSHCHDALQYCLIRLNNSQSSPIPPKVLARITRDRGPRPGGFMAS